MKAFASEWISAPKALPSNVTVCAIGDVHGCVAHLRRMVDFLQAHIISSKRQTTLILIGDYIDRGPASLETLAYVRSLSIPAVEVVKLLGNHDFFLSIITGKDEIDAAFIEYWLDVGGESTFKELGFTREDLFRVYLDDLRTRIRDRLGDGMPAFLSSLAPSYRVADYLFVHAGLNPMLSLDEHDVSDLVMMREPFLSGVGWIHNATVVHGHTIRGHEALPHRIATDTGVFRTGVLSCVQLEGSRLRWIAVTEAEDVSVLGTLKCSMAGPLDYSGPFSISP